MTKGWSCCVAIADVIDIALILGDMLNKKVSPHLRLQQTSIQFA